MNEDSWDGGIEILNGFRVGDRVQITKAAHPKHHSGEWGSRPIYVAGDSWIGQTGVIILLDEGDDRYPYKVRLGINQDEDWVHEVAKLDTEPPRESRRDRLSEWCLRMDLSHSEFVHLLGIMEGD